MFNYAMCHSQSGCFSVCLNVVVDIQKFQATSFPFCFAHFYRFSSTMGMMMQKGVREN